MSLTKLYKLIPALALTLAAGAGTAAFAQPPQRGERGASRAKAHLALTDSQMQNLRTMREQQRGADQTIMDELQTKQQALRDQVKAGNADAATLGRLLLDIEAAKKRLDASRQSLREQALASLTPDQKARLQTLVEARKLAPAIQEAEMLGLLDPPAGPGPGGEGFLMGRPGGPGGASRMGVGGKGGASPMRRPGGPPPPPRADQ